MFPTSAIYNEWYHFQYRCASSTRVKINLATLFTLRMNETLVPLNVEISTSGGLAYDVGRYKQVNKRPEGPVKKRGCFVTLYMKIDGDW